MSNPKAPFYGSQRNDNRSGGDAPIEAHLALLTQPMKGDFDPDALLPIPPGAHVFFISDPRRADGVTECILQKVIYEGSLLKEIRLVAYTRSTKSTRILRLMANWEGKYESGVAPTVSNDLK